VSHTTTAGKRRSRTTEVSLSEWGWIIVGIAALVYGLFLWNYDPPQPEPQWPVVTRTTTVMPEDLDRWIG
jgi:hypothetical protein